MRSRRQLFYLSVAALLAVAAERALHRRPGGSPTASLAPTRPPAATPSGPAAPADAAYAPTPIWLPIAQGGPQPIAPTPMIAQSDAPSQLYLPIARKDLDANDPPLLGQPSGTAQRATDWLVPRAAGYTPYDVATIVAAYTEIGDAAGLDWFLALAQMALETGSLTSWWSQRPRRNPAGIGVTGRVQPGTPDNPPGPGWTWDGAQWREGLSFATWVDDAIPAHLGRLLAYALTDEQASDTQRALIDRALAYRPLPESYRGIAPTITGLNGRWAVPGTNYGQNIAALAQRMRDGV